MQQFDWSKASPEGLRHLGHAIGRTSGRALYRERPLFQGLGLRLGWFLSGALSCYLALCLAKLLGWQ